MLQERRANTSPTLETLTAKCQRLQTSRWFGCLTRNGLDEAITELDLTGLCLVYWDVDDLKRANELWGKPESSARIANAIKMRGSDIICGQYFSGDEFMAFIPVDEALGFVRRLRMNFAAVDMSATYVIAENLTDFDIDVLGDQCDAFVTLLKSLDLKGTMGYL